MKDFNTKNDNGGAWINFYKLPDKEIYWSGSVGYSTKEIAQYNNSGECYRIATLNIKDVLNQQAEINRLREALKNICIEAKRGKNSQLFTPETAVLSRIENDCFIALNGESEEK